MIVLCPPKIWLRHFAHPSLNFYRGEKVQNLASVFEASRRFETEQHIWNIKELGDCLWSLYVLAKFCVVGPLVYENHCLIRGPPKITRLQIVGWLKSAYREIQDDGRRPNFQSVSRCNSADCAEILCVCALRLHGWRWICSLLHYGHCNNWCNIGQALSRTAFATFLVWCKLRLIMAEEGWCCW